MNFRITFNCPEARVISALSELCLLRCIHGHFTMWITANREQNSAFWRIVDELDLDVAPWGLHNNM